MNQFSRQSPFTLYERYSCRWTKLPSQKVVIGRYLKEVVIQVDFKIRLLFFSILYFWFKQLLPVKILVIITNKVGSNYLCYNRILYRILNHLFPFMTIIIWSKHSLRAFPKGGGHVELSGGLTTVVLVSPIPAVIHTITVKSTG